MNLHEFINFHVRYELRGVKKKKKVWLFQDQIHHTHEPSKRLKVVKYDIFHGGRRRRHNVFCWSLWDVHFLLYHEWKSSSFSWHNLSWKSKIIELKILKFSTAFSSLSLFVSSFGAFSLSKVSWYGRWTSKNLFPVFLELETFNLEHLTH